MNLVRLFAALLTFVIMALYTFIETTAGLPNTCSQCGTPAGPRWYAENVDQARSGLGLCATCAGKEQDAEQGEEAGQQSGDKIAAAEVGAQLRKATGQPGKK